MGGGRCLDRLGCLRRSLTFLVPPPMSRRALAPTRERERVDLGDTLPQVGVAGSASSPRSLERRDPHAGAAERMRLDDRAGGVRLGGAPKA